MDESKKEELAQQKPDGKRMRSSSIGEEQSSLLTVDSGEHKNKDQ